MQLMCEVKGRLGHAAIVLAVGVALAGPALAQDPVFTERSAATSASAPVPGASPSVTAAPVGTGNPSVPEVTPGAAPAFTAAQALPLPAPAASQPPVVRYAPLVAPGYAPPLLEPPAIPDARFTDAHVDRVVFVPTAETHPAGTVYLSSYDIVGLQGGVALGDRTQLTLSFVPPLSREPVVPLDLTLKTVLARAPRVRVAAMVSASGVLGTDEGAIALGRVGGVAQLCFDDACRSSVSTAGNLVLAGSVLVLANGVGAIVRASNLFAVLVELQSVLPLSRDGGQINVLGGALGFRLSGRVWAVDLALEGPLDRHASPAVLPVLVASVRFL